MKSKPHSQGQAIGGAGTFGEGEEYLKEQYYQYVHFIFIIINKNLGLLY